MSRVSTAERMARQRKLLRLQRLIEAKDPRVAAAIVTILELAADSDRRRAMRLFEAVGTIVAFATRPARAVRP